MAIEQAQQQARLSILERLRKQGMPNASPFPDSGLHGDDGEDVDGGELDGAEGDAGERGMGDSLNSTTSSLEQRLAPGDGRARRRSRPLPGGGGTAS